MIDLKDLKLRTEYYKSAFKNKGLNLDAEVDRILLVNKSYLELLKEEEIHRTNLNKISIEIKNAPTKIDKLKLLAQELSEKTKIIKNKKAPFVLELEKLTTLFPNPAGENEPIGNDEKDNIVLKTFLDDKKEKPFAKPHWKVLEKNHLILPKEANLISGTRQVIYSNKGAQVIKAIEKLMLDLHLKNNYLLIDPPVIVNSRALFNTGQLPKFADDLYKLEGEDQYLIPTAEVPLTNLVANKILKAEELPLKFVAFTQCFRKEAGAAGKDTRGIIRLHQFRKVELVKIGHPKNEKKDFDELLKQASKILEVLELPYRTLQLCSGDMSFSAKKTIDLEVWMPGIKTYREISSCSCMGQFQARRMQARLKNKDGSKELVNTYNASGLAIGRTFAAIIENYLQEDGQVLVPKALKKYLDFDYF